MFCCLLLLLVEGVATGRVAITPGFVPLPQRPSKADFDCANYSKTEWAVSYAAEQLRVSARADSRTVDALPFTVPRQQDTAGDRHFVRVEDGWLIGFDAGEFGGGRWWLSEDGGQFRLLRPPASAPVHANDIFRAENVQGFAPHSGRLLVFMGLDHLGGRSGRIFAVSQAEGTWTLEPFAALNASPAAWVIQGERVLVLTESGLWQALPDGRTEQLHDVDIGLLYPNSMVEGPDGALYAGMRRYVLRLEPSGFGWKETWLVPSGCVRAKIEDYACHCVP